MSKHILFDASGVLKARYDSNAHGELFVEQQNPAFDPESPSSQPTILVANPDCKIPAEAIEVSESLFWQTINETDGVWSLVNGSVVKKPFPAPTLSSLVAEKRIEVNSAFELAIQQITIGYPADEISSWSKQESEARAYSANNASATPLIDALSAARGVAKSDLVTRIVAKADLFAAASGQLIGKRQRLEDQINALPANATASDVALIVW